VKVEYYDTDQDTDEPLKSDPKTGLSALRSATRTITITFQTPEKKAPAVPQPLPHPRPAEVARPRQAPSGLESKVSYFPGMIALDFGTSNSAVAVYDPAEIRPWDGLPLEQERRLRDLLADWAQAPAASAVPGSTDGDWDIFRDRVGKNLGLRGRAGPVTPLRGPERGGPCHDAPAVRPGGPARPPV